MRPRLKVLLGSLLGTALVHVALVSCGASGGIMNMMDGGVREADAQTPPGCGCPAPAEHTFSLVMADREQGFAPPRGEYSRAAHAVR